MGRCKSPIPEVNPRVRPTVVQAPAGRVHPDTAGGMVARMLATNNRGYAAANGQAVENGAAPVGGDGISPFIRYLLDGQPSPTNACFCLVGSYGDRVGPVTPGGRFSNRRHARLPIFGGIVRAVKDFGRPRWEAQTRPCAKRDGPLRARTGGQHGGGAPVRVAGTCQRRPASATDDPGPLRAITDPPGLTL